MENFYCIWKPDLKARREIIPMDFKGISGGHISVYNFDDHTAKAIGFEKNYVIKKNAIWYSKDLLIDVDDKQHVPAVRDKLKQLEISYDLYETGGKGVHFHVPRENMPSNALPYSDLTFLTTNSIFTDPQVYGLFHTIRNIGAIHEKTNKAKVLTERHVSGKPFSVPLVDPLKIVKNTEHFTGKGESIFSDPSLTFSLTGYTAGNRYPGLMLVAGKLAKFQLNDAQAYFILDQVAKACEPKFTQLDDIWRFYKGLTATEEKEPNNGNS